MFALWRSCQHYSEPDLIPEATAETLPTLLAAAAELPTMRKAKQYVGRTDRGNVTGWTGVGFIKNGELEEDMTPGQIVLYDRCRAGRRRFSNPAYPPLTPADHPDRTINLDT